MSPNPRNLKGLKQRAYSSSNLKKATAHKKAVAGRKKSAAKGKKIAGGKAAAAKRRTHQKRSSGGRGTALLIYMGMAGLLFFSPPIAALALLGLLPTFIVLFVDISPEKAIRLSTMFAFNISGVLPMMLELWDAGGNIESLMPMLSDITTWTVMFGAAGVGTGMLWVCPMVAATFQQSVNVDKAKNLEKQRDFLISEWGEAVAARDEDGPGHISGN